MNKLWKCLGSKNIFLYSFKYHQKSSAEVKRSASQVEGDWVEEEVGVQVKSGLLKEDKSSKMSGDPRPELLIYHVWSPSKAWVFGSDDLMSSFISLNQTSQCRIFIFPGLAIKTPPAWGWAWASWKQPLKAAFKESGRINQGLRLMVRRGQR